MKKVIIALLMVGLFGACSKDEEEKKEIIPLSQYLIAQKKETNQDSILKLLDGAWRDVNPESGRRVYVSKNDFGYTNNKAEYLISSEKYFFVKTGGAIQIVDESNSGYVSALLVKVQKDTMFVDGLERFKLDEDSRDFKESYILFRPSDATILKKVKFD